MALDIERAKRDGVLWGDGSDGDGIYRYVDGPDPDTEYCIKSDGGYLYVVPACDLSNLPDPIEQCREKGIVIAECFENVWMPIRGGMFYRRRFGFWDSGKGAQKTDGWATEHEAARAVLEHESKL